MSGVGGQIHTVIPAWSTHLELLLLCGLAWPGARTQRDKMHTVYKPRILMDTLFYA
jgi:hypothetical protein